MRHGLLYHGSYEENYAALKPGATTFRSTDGSETPIPEWPSDFDGLRVGYLEKKGKKFVASRLMFENMDIVLKEPVVLDPLRHMGNQRFAAGPVAINDESAEALIDDAIACNPDQTEQLAMLINRINQVRRLNR